MPKRKLVEKRDSSKSLKQKKYDSESEEPPKLTKEGQIEEYGKDKEIEGASEKIKVTKTRKDKKTEEEQIDEPKLSRHSLKEKSKDMAVWSQLQTKQDILAANLRVVPSKVAPSVKNKAGSKQSYIITGEELARRVLGPENLTSTSPLCQLLCLSKGGHENDMGHSQKELKRLVSILKDETSNQKTLYSAYSTLPEGDVEYMSISLQNIAAAVMNEHDVKKEVLKEMNLIEKMAAVETTRKTVENAICALENTKMDVATHGGIKLVKAAWNIIKSVLPGQY